jgi:hypothetical protein
MQIADAVARLAQPNTVCVTVYGHAADPNRPGWNVDPVLAPHPRL